MRLHLTANGRLNLVVNRCPVYFQAVPHPNAGNGTAHTMEGTQSTVYHLQEIGSDGAEYALKVIVPRQRGEYLVTLAQFLGSLRNMVGFGCCERFILTRENAPDSIANYPDLEFAMMMPWLTGTTWMDAHLQAASVSLSRWKCLRIATRLAEALGTLEKQELSHCKLSPWNVVIDLESEVPQVELLGLEHVYSRHLPVHEAPRGWPEYSHRAEQAPGPYSHRFPGALLISEILSWYHEDITTLFPPEDQGGPNESLFTADELHDPKNPKFRALRAAVEDHHGDLAALLDAAWTSPLPENAPSIQQWMQTLERVSRTKIEYAWKRLPKAQPAVRQPPFWETSPGLEQMAANGRAERSATERLP